MDRRDAPLRYAQQQTIRACAAVKSGCLDASRRDAKRDDVYHSGRPNLRATPVTDHAGLFASAVIGRAVCAAAEQIPNLFAAVRRYRSRWRKDQTPTGYP